ncbi:MAG: proton-conducting membrane transporter [Oscillospiraceae bacterium]|nr:proton-conducting membrane transporter [Oscillospiraceae bacterium]
MLTYFVLAPIVIAVFLYLFSSNKTNRIIAIVMQAIITGFALYLLLQTRQQGEILTFVGNYQGLLGVVLKADMMAASFVLLTALLFLVVAIYSLHEENSKLFWLLMFIWEGLLIGIFLSRDFFNVFVLAEVATVVVAVLIMYDKGRRNMFDGLVFLMANTVAIQFYLFGIGYVYMLTGVLDMQAATDILATLPRENLILPYALMMTAIAFKAAVIPMYSWLPKVQGIPRAPDAVAALLSGLHVKSAIFLFIRFQDVFAPVASTDLFLVIGLITAIVGVVMAVSQVDIKLLLAYSSTAQIGLIIAGLSIDDPYSHAGSLYHMISHALYKVALFLIAGVLSGMYGTRDMRKIKGIFKKDKFIGIAIVLALLGITGAPLFNGNVSKYFIMSGADYVVNSLMILINLGTILVAIKFGAMLFGTPDESYVGKKTDKSSDVAIYALCLMCFAGGIFGEELMDFLFNAPFQMSFYGFIEKIIILSASWVVGLVVYKYVFADNKNQAFFGRIRAIDLNFRGICVSIGAFFVVALAVVGFLS